ncbi:MAG: GNAT family N-acetyltransferase [Rhodobacter sp.]|nr:GNAT family N-acetyltransferase [Rhodobacter sp.]
MLGLRKGRYVARLAATATDVAAAQRLRFRAFRAGGKAGARDVDDFDAVCAHVLVEEARSGRLVCCFRLLVLEGGAEISRSYSAQYYDLSALAGFPGRMAEMGRFCIDPDLSDGDILRVAWGAMTGFVDEQRIEMLFGCSSFAGTETQAYHDAFAMLRARHLAPKRWLPRVKAPDVFRFARRLRRAPDMKRAMLTMPPLLRTYLLMGGWVSDHAVVDRDLNTLHVFTGLEIRAIPPARARLLRAIAGEAALPRTLPEIATHASTC